MHRSRSRLHVLIAALSLVGLFAACGGKVTGGASGGDGGGGGGTGGSGSSSGGSGSSGSGGSGGSCVTVPASSLSRTCSTAADCTVVTTGTVCPDSCDCGNTAISNSALAQYEADVASIPFGEACPCPSPGVVDCVNGTCTLCDTPGSGACTVAVDAGPSSDGGACIDLEPSMFDTSCTTTSDCVDVTLGELCDSGCLCGGSAINVADQAKYNQLAAGVPPGEVCGCPYFGKPVCAGGQCIVCGGRLRPTRRARMRGRSEGRS